MRLPVISNRAWPFILVAVTALLSAVTAHADPEWTMVWDDEFLGAANTSPDPTRWTYDLGGGGWGNGELETYTNSTSNVYVDGNGHLVISANYSGGNYTSARIKTQTLFDQAYGRVEAYIMIPQGNGIWPAFWMLGSNINTVSWPACGEIDMMENIGQYDPPNVIGGHIHGPVQPGGGDYNGGDGVGTNYTLPSGNFTGAYHLFAAEWNPTQITFYVDGTAYQTLTAASLPAGGTWVFNHPFFILLNLAVGGVSGTPNSAVFPQQMLVHYVRVYKLTDNGTSPYGGTAPTVPGTIQAENYDTYDDTADPAEPGEGFAYNGLGATNVSGQYRTGDAVSIESCSDTGGGYDVDYTSPGQWLQYTVQATQTGNYTLDARVASDEAGGTFHFDVDGNTVTGELTAPNTNGWQNWADITAGPIALAAGQHTVLLVEDTMSTGGLGVCNFNYFTLSLPVPTPSVTVTPTFIPTDTPTDTPTASPSASGTATATPPRTATSTGSPTASATMPNSPSPSGTPTPTASPSSSASAAASPSGTLTPAGSPTATATLSPTPALPMTPTASSSWTPNPTSTSEPTFTPSASPTESLSPTSSPSFSPSSSATPGNTARATSTETTTPTLSQTPTATTAPDSPTAEATPEPTEGGQGINAILQTVPLPDPNPASIRILLAGGADEVNVKIYTGAMVDVAENSSYNCQAGWNSVALPGGFLHTASNGIYYYRVTSVRNGIPALRPGPGKFVLMR